MLYLCFTDRSEEETFIVTVGGGGGMSRSEGGGFNGGDSSLSSDSWETQVDVIFKVGYCSVKSLMRLNSRMQKIPAFVFSGQSDAKPSGLSRQNLFCAMDSLLWPSSINFRSVWVRGRLISRSLAAFHIESFVIFSHCRSSSNSSASSFQIVSMFFSPVMHMNLHLEEASLASSRWIRLQHLWWSAV